MTDPGCWLVPGHDQASCIRIAPGGYCTLRRCYCGGCPWYLTREQMPTFTPDRYTLFDKRAILSSTGRRTSLAEYRAAQSLQVGVPPGP